MPDLLDQIARQKRRLLKEQQDKQQAETREQQRKRALAKSVDALKTRQAVLLGETIRDADLTEAEQTTVRAILARRTAKPKDWRLIADWLPPEDKATSAEQAHDGRRIPEPDTQEAAAGFADTRAKSA
jgi:hypothetical protein